MIRLRGFRSRKHGRHDRPQCVAKATLVWRAGGPDGKPSLSRRYAPLFGLEQVALQQTLRVPSCIDEFATETSGHITTFEWRDVPNSQINTEGSVRIEIDHSVVK